MQVHVQVQNNPLRVHFEPSRAPNLGNSLLLALNHVELSKKTARENLESFKAPRGKKYHVSIVQAPWSGILESADGSADN